uniref:restriction endonuclease subunit S n=1 Tax=Prochlorothrix hollandica TaxID=1223 RepID=UPI00333EF80E
MTSVSEKEDKFISGWTKCKLPEFCYLEMGQSPPSNTYNSNGIGLPFYQGKSEFGSLYPTPEKYCSAPNKIAKKGDILLSVRAPVGPTNMSPHEACIGRGLAAIRPLDSVQPKFVLFLFRNLEKQIEGKGTGTTLKAITKDFLTNLELKVPPLAEQHRIVDKIEELFS